MLALRDLEPRRAALIAARPDGSSPGGNAAFNVLIRTLDVQENVGQAALGLGLGLVVDSEAGR
jgi:hypothetical protein